MANMTKAANFNFQGDNLVYVVNAPGGVDGLDSSNRGGPVWAFPTEEEAKKKIGSDTRYKIKPAILNVPEIRRGLRKKLTVMERLYMKMLGFELR